MSSPLLIAITSPAFLRKEEEAIVRILDSGAFDRVHIRKPDTSEEETRRLLERIPTEFHHRISLHDHPALAKEFGCGFNINARNPGAAPGFNGVLSRSCHSHEELIEHIEEDYLLLSPVYPSISKSGYAPKAEIEEWKGKVDRRVIALGGVTPERIAEICSVGFGGAAMLGRVWEEWHKGNLNEFLNTLNAIKRNVSVYHP